MKLVLFDIDGTLVLTGGAGLRAMNRACAHMAGHGEALARIPVAGRTDRIILMDAIVHAGRDLEETLLLELRDRYLAYLAEEIGNPGRGMNGVMPGVRQLLDALSARDDVFLGLLTGNFEAGARIKLGHFDLWRYFTVGAYGDDAADRNLLVPFALKRARALGLPDISPEHILVVGDTPHDVACARAVNALPIGVATGGYTVEQLRESGADVVFGDLTNTDAFLALLG